MSVFGNDAADEDARRVQAGFAQELQDARHQGHVSAAQKAQAQPVGVLVGHGADDRLGRLPEPGVDDFHAGVAEAAGDDLDAAVVAVEADLGQNNADRKGAAAINNSPLPLCRSVVAAEDVGQGVHDLADRAACAGGLEEHRHQVLAGARPLVELHRVLLDDGRRRASP